MEELQNHVDLLLKSDNLSRSVDSVQRTIDLLTSARDKVAADPQTAAVTLAKLQQPVKQSSEKVLDSLKKANSRLKSYEKSLNQKFKQKTLPTVGTDALSEHPSLVTRAIGMHLLREGQFSVASTFIEEAKVRPPVPDAAPGSNDQPTRKAWESELATVTFNSVQLQQDFADMYHILQELRQKKNLGPAIAWARERSRILESRGSNLEFELCRLQFVCLYTGQDELGIATESADGPLRAWAYARSEFGPFQHRYAREVQQLMGSLAFYENVADSPYTRLFYNDSAWEEVANSFTREFCSLLGLSADSPLYIAATAGAMALPALLKVQNLMNQTKAEWTTRQELPVEVPLPESYHFHSIFVCPVSKEQTTDENPPKMMPCGHVISQESLDRLSKGGRFKCPYCPAESHARDAKTVFL